MMANAKKKKMDVYFAVFNNHVNNADWLAKCQISAKFGREGLSEIAKVTEVGIMSIFHCSPTPVTQFYVDAVHGIVNMDRVD